MTFGIYEMSSKWRKMRVSDFLHTIQQHPFVPPDGTKIRISIWPALWAGCSGPKFQMTTEFMPECNSIRNVNVGFDGVDMRARPKRHHAVIRRLPDSNF